VLRRERADLLLRHLYGAEFPYADRSIVKVQNGNEDLYVDFKTHKLEQRLNRPAGLQARETISLWTPVETTINSKLITMYTLAIYDIS